MGGEGDWGLRALRPETAPLILASRGQAADEACAVRVRHEPGYVLVTVIGDVDYATIAGLRERLFALAATGRPLVVDLDLVSFIDAAGLGALVGAARRAAARGVGLHVVCARSQIRRLFHITGLDQAISLAGTLREAIGANARVS